MSEPTTSRVAPLAAALARDDWPVLVGLPAVASLFVFAVPSLGWWALGTSVLVYVAGFISFERARAADETYRQLGVVLGRIPELSEAVPLGHADRTAQLAASMAGLLGSRTAEAAAIEEAARVHAIGRVGLEEPALPSGLRGRVVGRRTAAIMMRAGSLGRTASLLAPEPPIRAATQRSRAIVDVAAAYDEAVFGAGRRPDEAVRALADAGRADVVDALAQAVAASRS